MRRATTDSALAISQGQGDLGPTVAGSPRGAQVAPESAIAKADHQPPPSGVLAGSRRSAIESGRRRPRARVVGAFLVAGGLTGFAWLERGAIERSVTVAQRADWKWVVVAIALELASMAGFARTQRVILSAAGVRISVPAIAATAWAGNAISVSLPLIGPGTGTAFTFGRFRRVGGDAASAGWVLAISGVVSNLVWALMFAFGAAVSGNPAATVAGLAGGVAILAAAIAAALALRRPRFQQVTKRRTVRLVQRVKRWTGRPAGDPGDLINGALDRLLTVRMSRVRWTEAVSLSLLNWLASAGCLAAAILSVRASVPWTKLLLIYCAGAAAGSFNLTPGGLGVVEGALAAGLVAAGMRSPAAFGSVLIFRLVTFWLVVLAGWTIYALLRRAGRQGGGRT